MILRRLRVEQFRQHNFPVEIVFDDHLTVVCGLKVNVVYGSAICVLPAVEYDGQRR